MMNEVIVEGMTCAGCANTVKRKFEAIDGVKSVDVDLENKKVTLESLIKIDNEILMSVLSDTNYLIVEY